MDGSRPASPCCSIILAFGEIADTETGDRGHRSSRRSGRGTTPQAPGEPASAGIDAASPADELVQRFGIRFVDCRVSHDPGPFAPSTPVGFCWIRGAPDHRGEGVFPIRHFQPLQAQSPASSVDLPTLRGPPRHQSVHGGEVGIDRVAVPSGLAVSPDAAQPLQVLAQAQVWGTDVKPIRSPVSPVPLAPSLITRPESNEPKRVHRGHTPENRHPPLEVESEKGEMAE